MACTGGAYTDDLDELECSQCPADTFTPSSVLPWDTQNDCRACAVCNRIVFHLHRPLRRKARGQGCGLDWVHVLYASLS